MKKNEEENWTSVSTGYATFSAEDISHYDKSDNITSDNMLLSGDIRYVAKDNPFTKGVIPVDNEDFGILAVCAIRYCQGRQTYMPELVRGIIRGHISEVTDKDLQVMINDCEYQYAFGDENIDKPRWIEWKEFLINEQKRRKGE